MYALAYDWSGRNNWGIPLGLIGRVIAHMHACKARVVLMVPLWPRKAWWPLVRSRCGARLALFVVENMPLSTVSFTADQFTALHQLYGGHYLFNTFPVSSCIQFSSLCNMSTCTTSAAAMIGVRSVKVCSASSISK